MSARKIERTGGLENLLPAIFPWKITGTPDGIRLALSLLVPLPKPSFAVTVSDDGTEWTLWLSEGSFKFIDTISYGE